MSSRPRSRSLRASVLALACLSQLLAAQGHKLSGPLARPLGGDIFGYKLSPDGSRVVYVADQETDGAYELFAAKPNAAGAVMKLAAATATGSVGFESFWIGPRSRYVVFLADLDVDAVYELHRVPLDGGAVVKLSGSMPFGGDVAFTDGAVQFDPTETRIVYLADQDQNDVRELYSVALDGSGPAVKLNPPLARGQKVTSFQISADGSRVVYLADQDAVGVDQLFSVPLAGGPALRLNPPEALDVQPGFQLESRGRFVVFAADIAPGKRQLFSTRLAVRGPSQELLPAPVRNLTGLRTSADGTSAVCFTTALGGNTLALVAAPVGRLHGARTLHAVNSPGERFDELALTPDSRFALFEAGLNGGAFQLFRAPLDGSSASVALAQCFPSAGLALGPDSTRVVFGGIEGAASGLLSKRVDGSAPAVQLSTDFSFPVITPDGSRVLFLARDVPGAPAHYDLLSVPLDGSASPKTLNAPLPFGGNVGLFAVGFDSFLINPLDGRVVYFADQEVDEVFELFSAPADGSAPPLRVSATMPTGTVEGDVYGLRLTADGERAVYLADAHVDNQAELFSVRSDGRGQPLALHGPMAPGEYAEDFLVAPDGTRVVYQFSQPALNREELRVVPSAGGPSLLLAADVYGPLGIEPTSTRVLFEEVDAGLVRLMSVKLDGSTPPLTLHGPLPAYFGSLAFTPDGLNAVYATDEDGDHASEVFSVRVDGSAAPLRLDGAQVPNGGVQRFVLTAAGDRVVYIADQSADNVFELFVVPVDRSSAPLRLSPALSAFRGVNAVLVVGDHAFYTSDQALDDRFELYRVPLDGSTAPVRVSAPLVNRGNVLVFAVTSDGAHAVYQADQEVDERFELYSVAADGSGPVKKLNGPLGNGDVSGGTFVDDPFVDVFALSPDDSRVVFRAGADGKRELFVAPTDGSAAAVKVSGPLGPNDSVLSEYRFTADGRSVVYRALAGSGQLRMALFQASLDTPGTVRRLSRAGSVTYPRGGTTFVLTPDGQRVVFKLDQETLGVDELFLNFLARPVEGAGAPTRSVTVRR